MPANPPGYNKDYYRKNKDKILEYGRNYYKNHKEYYKEYAVKNREKIRKWQKEYLKNHPGYKKEKDAIYLNRKRYGGNREIVIQRDGEICQLCGMSRKEHREKYGRDIVVDHIDGSGGNNKYDSIKRKRNNSLDNLRTLCLVCNLKSRKEL